MHTTEHTAPEPRILLVEDNPIDVLLVRRALKNGGFKNQLTVLDDGEPAMAYLTQQSGVEGEALPDLVILDLNLRKVDGPEVLAYIRRNPALKSLRVIILSSSPEDVMKSNAGQADFYIEKPADAASFLNLGQRIRAFYFNTGLLNSPSSASAE